MLVFVMQPELSRMSMNPSIRRAGSRMSTKLFLVQENVDLISTRIGFKVEIHVIIVYHNKPIYIYELLLSLFVLIS